MALRTDKLGTTYEAVISTIDPAQALRYAAATNDPNPAYQAGTHAPPVFGVVPVWQSLLAAAADLIPADALMFIVHGEQDMYFHQPLVPGMELRTTATPQRISVGGSGTRLIVRLESTGNDGALVLTQYVTIFVRGMSDGESGGTDTPGHDFPEAARAHPAGTFVIHVDDDQTFRYREASGDEMPIHLDEDFAKSVGLPGIIAHGLCTMAMCSQAVIATVAGGDAGRLRRLAVRFAANVFPGSDIEVSLFDAGRTTDGAQAYAFEATSAGSVVIKNGWAEVR